MRLLRSALFNLWFYGVTLLLCLASPPVLLLGRFSGPRPVMAYARTWARLVLGGLRPLVGITWRVEGTLPPGPVLLAAQHQSAFETVLWAALLPDFCFVVKQELMRVPLFGGLMRAAGMIAVDRSGGMAALRGLLRDGARAAAERRQIVIFPEGTRVAPGVRAALHPGVAALAARGLGVVPVVTDSGRCWGRRAFRKHPGTIRVQVLPALPRGLGRDALLAQLAEAFARGPT